MVTKSTSLKSQFPVKLDDKERIVVPAEIRNNFDPERDGKSFVILMGVNDRPWLYPERKYEDLGATLATQLSPDMDMLEFDQMFFGTATEIKWDAQGRMPIPQDIRDEAKLEGDIVMVGVRNHYELWLKNQWEEQKKMLAAKRKELAAKQRSAETQQRVMELTGRDVPARQIAQSVTDTQV